VIDDVRARDALGVLLGAAAMPGVLMGMHAPSPSLALEQLELFAQVELGGGHGSLARLLSRAASLLVHVAPDNDGTRRVQSIAELCGARDETLEITTLYRYDGGFKAGEHKATFL
jgi:Flp pilus assembly CpaF family ATPase